ncbi:MAG: hypothetical protein ACON39_05800 [Coraliomargaritaceae bacterium]
MPVHSAINIILDYDSTAPEDIETYGSVFSAAESFWEGNLTGYQDVWLGAPAQVLIKVNLSTIDGVGGRLGQASPTHINIFGNFVETTQGEMTFDTDDLVSLRQSGLFNTVVRHEMGHVLGHGSLWALNGVYEEGTGQYTGASGLAAFREEFNQPEATYVPVELDGGEGTANGHWNMGMDLGSREAPNSRDDPGDTIVYTSVNNGEVLDNELMSGFLSGSAWLSETTLQSFYDIGYTVIPEPSAFTLPMLVLFFCFFGRRD